MKIIKNDARIIQFPRKLFVWYNISTFGYQYNTVYYYVLLFISYKIFTYAIRSNIRDPSCL